MKKLINKFKNMDLTKRIVIIFITISFSFIGVFSVYNSNKQEPNKTQITQTKTKKKDTKKETKTEIITEDKQEEVVKETETKVETKKETSKPVVEEENKAISQEPVKEAEVENNLINISLQVEGVNEIIMSGSISIEKDTTVYDALKNMANQKSISISSTGFGSATYVKGINGLKEFDYGPGSGWMYKVNGVSPNYGAKAYKLKDGDNVVWYYVTGEE